MEIEKNTLYVVGTPIGNLGDMTIRALEVLKNVDFIAAEDTRNTLHLLSHFEIKKPLISYFEHNKRQRGELILNRIVSGESCALVSDAGMPAISDPGEDLVKMCYEKNITVCPIPGPSALVTALCASGRKTGRFTFEGFLSTSNKSRREHLEEIKKESRTMIFYEAPHKLLSTLSDLSAALGGEREITVSRELTKKFEEFKLFTLAQAVEYYYSHPPKGEFVLIIEGKEADAETDKTVEAQNIILAEIKSGKSRKEAVESAVIKTGIRKNEAKKFAMDTQKE